MNATAGRLIRASSGLDPADRALLNLWLHRGLSDHEIAELSGGTSTEIAERRAGIVVQLADALDAEPLDVRQAIEHLAIAPGDAGGGSATPAAAAAADADTRGADALAAQRSAAGGLPAAEDDHSRRAVVVAGAVGIVVVVVALVFLVSRSLPGADAPRQAPPGARVVRSAALAPPAGSDYAARGRLAVLADGRLRLTVRELPPTDGAYVVWLYNSVIDSVAVGRLPSRDSALTIRPRDRARYRFLDISLQLPGDGARHSGRSVLRVPLRWLSCSRGC